MKITAFVLPDGSVVGRYADVLVMSAKLKPEQVRRVTNVEWNDRLEMWCARTMTGKMVIVATSRANCLEMESEFVDRLLAQFFLCRQEDGKMKCPECAFDLGEQVWLACPNCEKEFPNSFSYWDLCWSDFELGHLVLPRPNNYDQTLDRRRAEPVKGSVEGTGSPLGGCPSSG